MNSNKLMLPLYIHHARERNISLCVRLTCLQLFDTETTLSPVNIENICFLGCSGEYMYMMEKGYPHWTRSFPQVIHIVLANMWITGLTQRSHYIMVLLYEARSRRTLPLFAFFGVMQGDIMMRKKKRRALVIACSSPGEAGTLCLSSLFIIILHTESHHYFHRQHRVLPPGCQQAKSVSEFLPVANTIVPSTAVPFRDESEVQA